MKRKIVNVMMVLFVAMLFGMAGCGGSGSSSGGSSAQYNLDTLGVPKFVATNYIDLSQTDALSNHLITKISKFRSHDGHDYSDSLEPCRSMKHYFKVPDASTSIYSPVSGTITTLYEEWAGTQIHITSDVNPAFKFIIFHVSKARAFSVGEKIAEGFRLGSHIGTQTYSDIAVEVNTPSGRRLISYFETLTDTAFKPFKDRGIAAPADVIITKAQRDSSPLTCSGETFTNSASDPYPVDVTF